MKLKLDENLPRALLALFRESGYDALSVEDQGLAGKSDGEIAEACRNEDRILVTFDTDFTDVRTFPPSEYSGIAVLRPRGQGSRATVRLGRRLLDRMESHSIGGQLWIVEDSRIRTRA